MIILLVFDHWVIYVSIMDLIVVVEYLSEAKFYDNEDGTSVFRCMDQDVPIGMSVA